MKITIIGAGIHGLSSAIALSDKGFDVVILEKNEEVMSGTSGATHNRAHLGFHYPRSIDTAKECIEGLNFFKEKYPSSIEYPRNNYYLIEKDSKTSYAEYLNFCNNLGMDYKEEIPVGYVNEDRLQGGINTKEPIFNIHKLIGSMLTEIDKKNIKVYTNTEVKAFELRKSRYKIITTAGYFETDIILNATYSYANNIMSMMNDTSELTEYYLQQTEVVVVKSPKYLPCLTIMDGKFFSIMKYASNLKNHYLLYDPENSVLESKKGFLMEDKKMESNFDKMINHGSEYFPFMKDLKFVKSWFGTRPIPSKITNDSRMTRIISHKYPGIYSILEGKFISAPHIANQVAELIEEECTTLH